MHEPFHCEVRIERRSLCDDFLQPRKIYFRCNNSNQRNEETDMTTTRLPKSFRKDVAMIGVLMFVSSTAFAQVPAAPAPPPSGAPATGATAEAERVIVTGSNIPTAEEVGPNPVTTLNRDYIQKTGSVDTTQLLKDQPVNNSNAIPTANNGTSQGGPVGFTSVALRGLDPSASLVLVDGRRVTRVLGGTFVDINTIPLAAVESIEILKSGASAVYGADAVAGVVNIHLWKEFRGAQLSQVLWQHPGQRRGTL